MCAKKYHGSVTTTFFGNHHLFLFITVIERAFKLMNKKISITNNQINYLPSMIFFLNCILNFHPLISSSFQIFQQYFRLRIIWSMDCGFGWCLLFGFIFVIHPSQFRWLALFYLFIFPNENNFIMWLNRIHMPYDLFNKMCEIRFYFFVCFGIFWHIFEFSHSNGKYVYFITNFPVNCMIG